MSAPLCANDGGANVAPRLTPETATRFAEIALGHVRREFPNSPAHVLAAAGDAKPPADLHPVFYGSYDWHSCVHGCWMLARLLRLDPDGEPAAASRALFDDQLIPDKVAVECRYFAAPQARGFERPYGWAWLLALTAELTRHAAPWHSALAPLADMIVARFEDFLPRATYPVRSGAHLNTAFALRLAADYADTTQNAAFGQLLRDTAWRWYGCDADCPAWGEPGGDDFLSPTLVEAECLRRLLPPAEFAAWFARYLPRLAEGAPATLFVPAIVSDRTDGKIAHLDGLNLSRAWCWGSLTAALPPGDPRRRLADVAVERHLAASLDRIAEDYMGEHWLATFAVLALEGL